ncbi:MAG: hypothetical protein K9G38_04895 [Bacteroidales bacterium]|nr:hypothetical protein [Bacteroidales bacterium]
MKISRENRFFLQIAGIAILIVTGLILSSHLLFEKWEKRLIRDNMDVCAVYAAEIADEVSKNDSLHQLLLLLITGDSISIKESNQADSLFASSVEMIIAEKTGLEGGLFMKRINDFFGYAYPTSPPPVPVYGPPPRSYNIIKDQALTTIRKGMDTTVLHAFDPAVFPLSTSPVILNNEVVGAAWARIHIERELPVTKLKRVVNLVTIISLTGFLIMAMISLFLRTGIKNIRNELDNAKQNQGFRLKQRGGWFGFIPASINDMLAIIEKENNRRQELEKKLQQEEKLASLGKMIAGVAHEVKTPLAIIKMRVQMWERELKNNPELQQVFDKDSLQLVLNEIDRLSGLVKRLVVFSRPISKNLSEVNICIIIEEVLSLIDLDSGKKSINLKKQLLEKPPVILADPNSLKQVILNVLTNSIESIQSEGEIVVETISEKNTETLVIKISDTGSGILPNIMKSVFDPFFTTKDIGTGLGLSISREIITAHGGKITFSSNNKYETVCIISLPLPKKLKDN